MACNHLLKGICGCPPESPAPDPVVEPAETEEDVDYLAFAASLVRELEAMVAKDNFAEYCHQAWRHVDPAKLDWNWHHELVCAVLQGVFEDWKRGQDDRTFRQRYLNILFNMPPGTAKSKFIAVLFPTWCWVHHPEMKFTCLSVNEAVSLRDARASRDLIKSDWYRATFKPTWDIKGDQDAISSYGNTAGGERLSRPSGSTQIGLRADCLLLDDLNDPEEVGSKLERDKINASWTDALYNRVNDLERSLRIGVQQRLHESDWSGYILANEGTWAPDNRDGWLHIVLPAEFEVANRCVTPWGSDPRTHEGESIHPERLPIARLAAERARLRDKYWGIMQQRPVSVEGGTIKRDYWSFCRLDGGVREEFDGLPLGRPRPAGTGEKKEALLVTASHMFPGRWDLDWLAISLDCAAKKTARGSQWGMLVIGGRGGRRFVLDDRTKRGDILEILDTLKELVRTWAPDKILIEDKAAGDDVKTMLKSEMADGDLPMVVLEMIPTGNEGKEERLDACLPTLKNGLVHLLDGAPWLEPFVNECAMFPNGTNDDRVDALTQALNHTFEGVEGTLPDASAWDAAFSN